MSGKRLLTQSCKKASRHGQDPTHGNGQITPLTASHRSLNARESRPSVDANAEAATAKAPQANAKAHSFKGINLATLEDFQEDLHRVNAAEAEAKAKHWSKLLAEAKASESEANFNAKLLLVDWSDKDALLKSKSFTLNKRAKLFYFLKRLKSSKWCSRVDKGLYLERICLALAAGFQDGSRLALCGCHGHFCGLCDHCPGCCLHQRAEPVVEEYACSFASAPYWAMLTPSFVSSPEKAGLHFVTQKAIRGLRQARLRHYRPLAGKGLPERPHLSPELDVGKVNPISACFGSIFGLGQRLVDCEIADGAFACREVAWHFDVAADGSVQTWVTPNGSIIINSSSPITFEKACRIYYLFAEAYLDEPSGGRLYCDLHCESILSQKELDDCFMYALKPMEYARGYLQALNAGADLEALNSEISDRVFQGGETVLKSTRATRRFGNMNCRGKGYIGAGSAAVRNAAVAERRDGRDSRNKEQANKQVAESQLSQPSRPIQHRPVFGLTDLEREVGRESFQAREGPDL